LLVGDQVYVLKGDAKQIDRFAGGKVKVADDVSGITITLYSIDH
jgi:hypothetical protein